MKKYNSVLSIALTILAAALTANCVETTVPGQTLVSGGVLSADGKSIIMTESDGMGGTFNVTIPISELTSNNASVDVGNSTTAGSTTAPATQAAATSTAVQSYATILTTTAATYAAWTPTSYDWTLQATQTLQTVTQETTAPTLVKASPASYTRKSSAWARKLLSYGKITSINSTMVVTQGGTPALPLIAPPQGKLVENSTTYAILDDGNIDWNNPTTTFVWFDASTQVTARVFGNAFGMTTVYTDGMGNTQTTSSTLPGTLGETSITSGGSAASSSSSSSSSSEGGSSGSSSSDASSEESSSSSSDSSTTEESSTSNSSNSDDSTGTTTETDNETDDGSNNNNDDGDTETTTTTTVTTSKKFKRRYRFRRS